MTEGLVKQSIAELRDLVRCRRYMVDAVQVVADRIEELEAKLAKAVEAFDRWHRMMDNPAYDLGEMVSEFDAIVSTTLAELKGGK